MKSNFYFQKERRPYNKTFAIFFIIFCLLFLLVSTSGLGQFPIGQYPPTMINAELVDTAKVSKCGLPFHVTNKAPLSGQTAQWKAVKGTVDFLGTTGFSTLIRDVLMDTSIVTYTIFDAASNPLSIDSLVLIREKTACEIIDRMGLPMVTTCGSSITLYSKLQPGYTYMWNASSPNAQIANPFAEDASITFLAAGMYTINVTAYSPNGFFSIMDYIMINVTCTGTPANAGQDVTVAACQFPYTLSGNAPAAGESVQWEVVSGSATLQNATSRNAIISDATNGTQLRYRIFNGAQSSSDILIVNVNSGSSPVCDPIVSDNTPNCGDNVSINFNFGNTPAPAYTFQWTFPAGVTPIATPNNSAYVNILNSGNHQITVTITSPYNYNTFTKTIILNAACPTTVTQANAGQDIYLAPCLFPYTLNGNAPAAGETVQWDVLSGMATLQNSTSRNAIVLDAMNGTRLRYRIFNGAQFTSDTVTIYINPVSTFFCDPIVSDNTPGCGDNVSIQFNFGNTPPPFYTFQWIFSAGVTPVGIPNNSAVINILSPGNHVITVHIISPLNYNTFTKTIVLNATCTSVTPAFAGQDATAYCNRFRLAANSPAAGETGTWKLIEGIASIENVNNPTTYIHNFGSSKLVFVWTIANAFQSSTDTVRINVNSLDVVVSNVVNATCNSNNGSALAQATGGLPPYKVQWQGSLPGNTLSNVPAGKYYVSITDQSGCQALDSVVILNDCVGNDLYTVEGNVFAGNGLQQYGLVILMQDIGGLPIPVKTVHLVNGYYKFTDVEASDYLVYVLPYKDKALTQLDAKYLPTFYVNKVSIFFANPIHVIADTYSVDIHLVEKKAAHYGGSNLLTHVNMGTYTATPLLPALLFNDKNELVAASQYNGESVSFEDLAPGKYYISMSIDAVGYENSQLIEVGAEDKVSNVEVNQGKLAANKVASIFNSIKTFPNPFKESISIDMGNLSGSFTVKVIDGVLGKVVKEFNVSSSGGQYQIDTEDLPAGLYIMQISTGTEIKNLPLVKL